ncbi:hypothetical protein JQ559_10575 [Bradyrhizobium viridifuturi]|jgi:hypothetical protein|uniref:hypothetical protein n=1 Tax=Bradyrhizobium TaxID=374 RepID=UPI000397C08E|nr:MULTISPECIES: hypothetical protein [Bradyrhizobium]ERF85202.1 MAG: hypothetical protein C207_01340 [Bradyrhizobium sp. DFCI-1]QRI72725.1 hypothetical protein JQ507_15185 [Bradyrhizobium sp. PSBB068]MBR1021049.1 hypothetical protein [Bradyrhizobium viridifuturi]MBR1035714.1 hypothetical protein [Bradyrhizobium viridifuturi]MBR1044091.1 hypothetical protein [Bradyrhizobium viridifuturi]
MYDLLKDWAQISPGFVPVVALLAVLIAGRQLALNRISHRETTAKATLREYLKLAVQYPKLSQGDFSQLQGEELERYKWLVGYLLWSAEELLEFDPKEGAWTRNLKMLMKHHGDYLKSPEFNAQELGTYSAKTQSFIKDAVASN